MASLKLPEIKHQTTPLRVIGLRDFTAGMWYPNSYDALDVPPNSVRRAVNVDFDRHGGIRRRPGFDHAHTFDTGDSPIVIFPFIAASRTVVRTSDPELISFDSSYTDTVISTSANLSGGQSSPNQFTEFNNVLYLANGRSAAAHRYTTALAETVLTAIDPTFQDSYSAPSGTHFPKAEWIASHQGYMFAANYNNAASTETRQNRVRWSHPNDPGSWRTNDFIDIEGSGFGILGICAFKDHLLIFKQRAVYALYGYSAETFNLVKLSGDVGFAERGWAQGDGAVYWWSRLDQIVKYDGEGITVISEPISGHLQPMGVLFGAVNGVARGIAYHDGKLYITIGNHTDFPEGGDSGGPGDCIFVYDAGLGAWTVYLNDDFCPHSIGNSYDGKLLIGNANPSTADDQNLVVFSNESATQFLDQWTGGVSSEVPIPSEFILPWQDGGAPIVNKRWKRPEFISRASPETDFTIEVMHDYDETVQKTMTLGHADTDENYDVNKLQSAGTAKAISLRVTNTGEASLVAGAGTTWSIDNITLKHRPKRLRN